MDQLNPSKNVGCISGPSGSKRHLRNVVNWKSGRNQEKATYARDVMNI
ncbi:hypothetical protein CI610_02988 [invertebrate metagenome]|uniref:Uncharacterized protein n=1 Tax=invertebrate metagenome TaxID=1711999 RepID=A0A2H9T4F0_9ZZZZ